MIMNVEEKEVYVALPPGTRPPTTPPGLLLHRRPGRPAGVLGSWAARPGLRAPAAAAEEVEEEDVAQIPAALCEARGICCTCRTCSIIRSCIYSRFSISRTVFDNPYISFCHINLPISFEFFLLYEQPLLLFLL